MLSWQNCCYHAGNWGEILKFHRCQKPACVRESADAAIRSMLIKEIPGNLWISKDWNVKCASQKFSFQILAEQCLFTMYFNWKRNRYALSIKYGMSCLSTSLLYKLTLSEWRGTSLTLILFCDKTIVQITAYGNLQICKKNDIYFNLT